MGLKDRVNSTIKDLEGGGGAREFAVGPGAVPFGSSYGIDPSEWSPAEYGEYLATSNSVYTCATIRADLLKSVPLVVKKRVRSPASRSSRAAIKGGGFEVMDDGPVVDLLQKVNPYWTFRRLLSMTELSLSLWGRSFAFVERGPSGTGPPTEIWWARPDRIAVVPDVNDYIQGFLYYPVDGGIPIPFRPSETLWFRYPNPLNEFEGLSPIAAARLAADTASAAMMTNNAIFGQGLMLGGLITPKDGLSLSAEQASDLEEGFDRRFKGVDKAHRWGVLTFDVDVKGASTMGISPRDAEFLGLLKWTLEDVARAYKIPLDFIAGERTYANVEAAEKAIWIRYGKPETSFIGDELTEQLLPMFPPGSGDLIEFDLSEVDVLQEAEKDRWDRSKEQIAAGALTVNEWREEVGLDPVAWGSVWWGSFSLVPIKDTEDTLGRPLSTEYVSGADINKDKDDEDDEDDEDKGKDKDKDKDRKIKGNGHFSSNGSNRAIEYGSTEHVRLMRMFDRKLRPYEERVSRATIGLFERQRDSILDTIRGRMAEADGTRGPGDPSPFDLAKWIRIFREIIRPVFEFIVDDSGQEAIDEVRIDIQFDIQDPAAVSFLERRAQRFAEKVNETTWEALQASLAEGMDLGESIPQIEERVVDIMGDRIRSTPETIARTETIGAYNGGTLEGWGQSGVVQGKGWLAAIDDRTRDSHIELHKRYNDNPIPLKDDFDVLDDSGFIKGSAPAPGQFLIAEEDINCRCTMIAVLAGELTDLVSDNPMMAQSVDPVPFFQGIRERLGGLIDE